jgi:hypothetical protein
MKMVRDRTGRFPERPHYEPAEIDVECERLIGDFLAEHRGRVQWPIATEDLTCLVERHVQDLDLYADLSDEGSEVEGVTEFHPGQRPSVRISSVLSIADYRAHRLRTTLTHELGHVHFHGFLYELRAARLDLFDTESFQHTRPSDPVEALPNPSQKCQRGGIINAAEVDWMEWQAGYACGAFLMPAGPLRGLVLEFIRGKGILHEPAVASPEGTALIAHVAAYFDASRDAARVRLLKTKHLAQAASHHVGF